MWGECASSVSNGDSYCMDYRKARKLAPFWRALLPLPEMRCPW